MLLLQQNILLLPASKGRAPQRSVPFSCKHQVVCKAAASADASAKEQAQEKAREAERRRVKFHRLELSPEERNAERPRLLNQAEAELSHYCSTLDGEGEESEHCWLAYDYFERRKDDAEAGCEIDYSTGSRHGESCNKLDSFESFVRQLVGQAPISSFAHMLYTLRKSEVASTQKVEDVEGVSGALVDQPDCSVRFEVKGMPESPQARLTTLFQAMDKDLNGKLDVAEFREAMEKLGMTHLTGNTVSTILEAMDVHGPIDLEDFLNIVEAEEIYSDSPVARWLRTRRGDSKYWGKPLESL